MGFFHTVNRFVGAAFCIIAVSTGAAADVSVKDLTLGMSLAAVKAKIGPEFKYLESPATGMPSVILTAGKGKNEGYSLLFLNDKAIFIEYSIAYEAGKEIDRSTFQTALLRKYGPTSSLATDDGNFRWLFDRDNNLIPGATNMEELARCGLTADSPAPISEDNAGPIQYVYPVRWVPRCGVGIEVHLDLSGDFIKQYTIKLRDQKSMDDYIEAKADAAKKEQDDAARANKPKL